MSANQTIQPELEPCNEACRVKYEAKHNAKVQCGCGTGHKMEPFSTQIVHHLGQHWLLECLTRHLLAKRTEDGAAIKLITRRMQKHQSDIAKMHCTGPNCDRQVGRTYRMIGSAVYCTHCSHDIGGQG